MKMILCENRLGNFLFLWNLGWLTIIQEAVQGVFYFVFLAFVLTQITLAVPVMAQNPKKKTQKPNDSPPKTERHIEKTGVGKPTVPSPAPDKPAAPTGPQFATGWIDVESLSREEQINKVAETVVALHDTLQAHGLLSRDQPIQKLNEMWQKEKADFNKQWLSELFQKQDSYLEKLQTYNNSIQSENHKKGDIETLTKEIATFEKRIRDIEARIEENERWQENLKAVLESRLENIPISIVLVGRTQFKGSRAEVKKIIKDHLSVAAVQEIIGSRVQSYSAIRNDNLIANFIAKTEEGNAEVSEVYFRESTKLLTEHGQNNYYVYQFHRLEVYPFSKEKPISKTPEKNGSPLAETDFEVDVYIVANDSSMTHLPDKNARSSFNELKLTPQEQEFIRSQVEIADSSNKRVEAEIQKFRWEYDDKYNRLYRK